MASIGARPGGARPTPRERFARMQATHGNAAVGRSLARFGAGDQPAAGEVEGAAGIAAAQGHAEPEHLPGADARQEDLDEARIAQTALATAKRATSAAIGNWQATATLVGVQIGAITAAGGQVVGPPLAPFLHGSLLAEGVPFEAATAFAGAVGNGWLEWSASVRVPALPWYPSFAAVPAAFASPTPNIPSPLAALIANTAPVSAPLMAARIAGSLGSRSTDTHWVEAAATFASWFERSFAVWSATTMVTNVLGMGPVPTFAPPMIPIGPVVGGIGNMPPGGFTGAPFGGG